MYRPGFTAYHTVCSRHVAGSMQSPEVLSRTGTTAARKKLSLSAFGTLV